MKKLRFYLIFLILVVLAVPAATFAAERETSAVETIKEELQANINIVWTCIAAFLVFFMQAGFAMVETGFTRAKNAGNIIMKNLMDFAVGSLVFFIIGYGLMYGDSIVGFIGSSKFLLSSASPLTPEGLW